MSKFRKLHNKIMPLRLKRPQKGRVFPTLVNETEPFFLDMAINIGVFIFKGHTFSTFSTCNQMRQ